MRKRFQVITLMLAAGMMWSIASPSIASAVDVKLSGTMDFTFERRNIALERGYGANSFGALQRLRVGMDFIASENLSAYYMLQVGTGAWGSSAKGSKYGQDFSGGHQSYPGESRITTRYMYLDWILPGTETKIRMGKQNFTMPGFAFNIGTYSGGVQPGISINVPINDTFALTAFWQRPSANEYGDINNSNDRFRNTDIFGLSVPMNFEGFRFVPYAQVASLGNQGMSYGLGAKGDNAYGEVNYNPLTRGRVDLNAGTSVGWWAGFASQLTMFDPFIVSLDFVYGAKNASGSYKADNAHYNHTVFTDRNGAQTSVSNTRLADRKGWMGALRMEYKTAWGVPTLLTWYSSGDGANQTRGGGMMPTTDGTQAGTLGVAPTWWDNAWGLGGGIMQTNAAGTWGVSLAWNQISFVEDLFHDFSVTYFQGTNNKANVYSYSHPNSAYAKNGIAQAGAASPWLGAGYKYGISPVTGYLTTEDSAVDVSLSTTYSIYKNLAANLELGYLFTNFDENIRASYDANGNITSKPKYDNIWRMAINFRYTF